MKRCSLKVVSCGNCTHPEYMTKKNASFCSVDFPSFVGIIKHPDRGIILFDTGYDSAFFEATKSFPEILYRWTAPVTIESKDTALEWLKRLGYMAEDVSAIVISHFHGDHVAGLHNFPNAQIFCSRSGIKDVQQRSRFGRVSHGILSSLIPDDLESRAVYFEDCKRHQLSSDFYPFSESADILGDGSLLAVELPGHCPGHWGLAMRTENDRLVFFVGDASWSVVSIEELVLPPKITTMLLGNTKEYNSTLLALNELSSANKELAILPSHCNIALERFERGDK